MGERGLGEWMEGNVSVIPSLARVGECLHDKE